MNGLFLFFSSHFDRDKGLDMGRLSLNDLNKGTLDIWIASSSHTRGQGKEGFHRYGGYLPPQYRCKDLPCYFVKTTPIDMRGTRGVRGNFYQILPYRIKTDKGGDRADFGVHLDADYPGSLGCIVMSQDRFEAFEGAMESLKNRRLLLIPLFVQYS